MRAVAIGLLLATTPLMAGATDPTPDESALRLTCGHPTGNATAAADKDPAPVMLPGYGTGGFAVRHEIAAAQDWFTEGMRLAHAFAHKPAIAAFHQAVALDPTCAMCAWGEAWSAGQTINFGIEEKERKADLALATRAVELAKGGPALEQQLTAALVLRYGPNKDGAADLAFAKAMDALAKANPVDNEIAVLTADAWLIASEQDKKGPDGTFEKVTRALALLEPALQRNPDDTGAIHFYIHATEWNGVAAKALPYAKRLGALAPGASHLVHMPSHTFYRVGLYQDAATVNDLASNLDMTTSKLRSYKGPIFKLSYHAHNVQFGLGGALMAGDKVRALSFADQFRSHFDEIDPKKGWDELSSASAFYAYGRFGDPETVLAMPEPAAGRPYLRNLWRYARGEVLARKGDARGVRMEADRLQMATVGVDKSSIKLRRGVVEIARNVLLGRAAMLEGRPDLAADAYSRAAKLQATVLDTDDFDPPLWWYPVDRSVAAAQLAAGHYDAALKSAQTALKTFPNDAMALTIAARAARGLGQETEAARLMADARKVWSGDPGAVPLGMI